MLWTVGNLLLLLWHAPLGVHSAIFRHQPPQRAVPSQVDCFIQCEVVGSQISLDGVQPHDTRTPWWSLQVLWGRAVGIILASVSSSIPVREMCPNMERRRDWIIAVRLGCLVNLLVANKLVPFDSKQCFSTTTDQEHQSCMHPPW